MFEKNIIVNLHGQLTRKIWVMVSEQLYFQMQPPSKLFLFQNNFSVYLTSLTVTNRNSD